MKTYKKYVLPFFFLFVLLAGNQNIVAQDGGKSTTELVAKFTNQNSTKSLVATITYDKDGESTPLINAIINFYSANAKADILLGSVKTDGAGIATFELKSDIITLKNDTGLILLKANYAGNEKYEAAEVAFIGMEIVIELDFQLIDSVKTIVGTANSISKNGEKVPLNGFDIAFFTPSLFGPLPIGTGYLENGVCNLKFPKKLPGDSAGNIMVFAKIIDNEIYGNVTYSKVCPFAKKHANFIPKHGQLWTPDAPIWMSVTLFILIFGVWGHYVYGYTRMRKIYKLGKIK